MRTLLPLLLASALAFPLAAPATAGEGESAPPSRFFEAYDRNGDGKVTPDELDAGGDVFRLLDRDGDGAITPEDLGVPAEFRPSRPPRGPEGRGDRPRPREREGRAGPGGGVARGPEARRGEEMRRRLLDMDADGDGRVSTDEYQGPERFFENLDRNDDGFVDEREIDAALGQGGRGGAGRRGAPGAGPAGRWRERLMAMDTDGDGRVSADEYKGRMPFAELDRNGDGFLDAKDVQAGGGPGRGPGRPPRVPFEAMDANGDGKLTPDEFKADVPFERLDRDGDGVLSREEVQAFGRAQGGRRPPSPEEMRERFAQLDRNGDGVVDETEFPRPEVFPRLDTNGDGALSEDEFLAALQRRMGGGGGRRGGGLGPEALRRFDRDGDGKVSRDEFPGGDERFDRLDANGDGVLTEADRPAGAGAPGRPPATQRPRLSVAELDRDGNGKLSRNEFPGSDDEWRRLDKNTDGWVTPEEAR